MNKYIYGKYISCQQIVVLDQIIIIRVKLKLDQCEQINQRKKKAKEAKRKKKRKRKTRRTANYVKIEVK